MATVNFSVPEEVKRHFNKVFAHQNKSQIITELMKQAIEEHERRQQRAKAIEALLDLRAKQKPVDEKKLRKARHEGRP